MPYDTDERLKGYLDTNQMHREQMCLAVMAIERRFTDVRPRHPRGGRDGARDIEALFNGAQRTFGAVGFVNQANDSDEHKKKAVKKYGDDLTEALKQEPKPEVFVFFTNVNLTVGEKDALVQEAKAKGLAYAEVFDRERIRIALDSADGFGIRFQYLGIPLSEAEQATFFARWGDDIQGLISDGFSALQKSLNRIHFLQEAMLPLTHLTVMLDLNREYSAAEIGHFRAFAPLFLKAPVDGLVSIMFGTTDNVSRQKAQTEQDLIAQESGIARGMCGGQWEQRFPQTPKESGSEGDAGSDDTSDDDQKLSFEPAGSFSSVGQDPVKSIRLRYDKNSLIRYFPVPRVLDLDDCMFVLWLNRSLAEKVKAIRILANEYRLKDISAEGFHLDPSTTGIKAPYVFSAAELSDSWVTLRSKNTSAFHIRFSEMTPKRFFHATEVPDSNS